MNIKYWDWIEGLQVLYVSTSIVPATSPMAAKTLSVLQAKKYEKKPPLEYPIA